MSMSNIRLPGLIDPHVHLRDPGETQKEDFYTGTVAALAGGYTTVMDMPNNKTPVTTLARLEEKRKIAKEKIVCDIGFHFGSLGDNLDEFEKVKDKVLGLKLYLNKTTGNYLLDKNHLSKIFTSWPSHLPILVHAQDETFTDVLEVVKQTPRKLHLCHLSTQFELELVMKAKESDLPVTCGVTPHHLFLNEIDENHLGPFGKMKPELKSKKDVDFLWKHIGAIDCIESDHAAHTVEEKTSPGQVPFGVPGLETTLPLLLTAVVKGKLTMEDVIRLCHDNPKKIFNIKTDKQTFVEVDLEESYQINGAKLFTKSRWTPFDRLTVTGKVMSVTLHGKKVFEHGTILATPGSGKLLP